MPVSKIIQEFNQKHYKPLYSWEVLSSHRNPDTGEPYFYTVEQWKDGSWVCNCPAGSFKKKCHHVLDRMDELSQLKLK